MSGDQQHAFVHQSLSQPVVARVTTAGKAQPGATVSFQVTRGGGSVAPAQAQSDAAGEARTTWTMGPTAGEAELSVVASYQGRSSASVSARATADAARGVLLALVDGASQQAVVGSAVPVPPQVRASDSAGVALPGVAVLFTVESGGGTLTGAATTTDPQGIARLGGWTLGGTAGDNTVRATLAAPGLTAPPVIFSARGVPAGGLTLYPPREVAVFLSAPGAVHDTVTGTRFVFPEGGQGTLRVSRIAQGRPAPYGNGVTAVVEWTGEESVRLALPRMGDAEPNVLQWGRPRYTMDGPAGEQWLALPRREESADSVSFALTDAAPAFSSPALAGPAAAPGSPPPMVVAILPQGISSAQAQRGRNREREARDAVGLWRQNLPPGLQPLWDQEVAAHPLHVSWAVPAVPGDQNCVSRYMVRIRDGNPTIQFCVDAPVGRGYHEFGHMATELLGLITGRDGNAVLDRAPGELNGGKDHNWGSSWWPARYTITEDYAFFSELMCGSPSFFAVDGTDWNFVETLRTPVEDGKPLPRISPATVDYPTIEGFGIAVLGALARGRTNTAVFDFAAPANDSPLTEVPQTDLSFPFLAGVLTRLPLTIDELMGGVEAELTSQGYSPSVAAGLPVVLEAIGWSYRAHARVLKGDGSPAALSGMKARVGYHGPTKEYLLPEVGPTPAGELDLPRIYPGAPYFVRLYSNDPLTQQRDSVTFHRAAIARATPTTTALSFDLTLPNATITSVRPTRVLTHDTLTIDGSGFGSAAGQIHFNGNAVPASAIASWTDTRIKLVLPYGIASATGPLSVRAGFAQSNEVTLTVVERPRVVSLTGPLYLPDMDGSRQLTYTATVTGGTGPYTFRWYSLGFDTTTGNTITVTNGQLGMEAGVPGLRWIYLFVTDAAGTAAAWIMPGVGLTTEFSYGVGLGSPASPNFVVRGAG